MVVYSVVQEMWREYMGLNVYLLGEIYIDWCEQIIEGVVGLDVSFNSLVIDYVVSDDCGVCILGIEDQKFWYDYKGVKLNVICMCKGIEDVDVVVVCFGEKYKQWNVVFDVGYVVVFGKFLIVLYGLDY